MAFVGRAVGCLASGYVSLRGISHNKPADTVADSIAGAVADCVPSAIDAIKSDIHHTGSRSRAPSRRWGSCAGRRAPCGSFTALTIQRFHLVASLRQR